MASCRPDQDRQNALRRFEKDSRLPISGTNGPEIGIIITQFCVPAGGDVISSVSPA